MSAARLGLAAVFLAAGAGAWRLAPAEPASGPGGPGAAGPTATATAAGPTAPFEPAGATGMTAGPLTSDPSSATGQSYDDLNAPYDGLYHFVRIRYDVGGGSGFGRRRGREPMWAHDYPRGERNFVRIIDETTFVDPLTTGSNVLELDDPELFRYPIAYIVEVGAWNPTAEEVAALGEYLLKGGFLIVDDTRDERGDEFANFAHHMSRALPGYGLIEIDRNHEIFDSFFRIDPLSVIPPYGPRTPLYYGIFEENDPSKRLLVIFNFNNDLSEYWEYSDYGYYPIDLSNEAYKLGVNYIVYAHTH
jgi:hypothetical protein